jgi:hypothetical protein
MKNLTDQLLVINLHIYNREEFKIKDACSLPDV